ncbi:MAG: hypothetical protein HRU41_00025 [Saprospiraceae bacterium]|nr:hypothetical protein [Saprospiraceae bacterium]
MKPTTTCLIVALLLGGFSFTQPKTVQDLPLDSIITQLNSNLFSDAGDFYEIAWESLYRASTEKDNRSAAELHSLLSDWMYLHLDRFPIDSSIYHRNKQIAYHQSVGDTLAVGDGYVRLAADLLNDNQLEEAQKSILTAVEIFEKQNDPNLLAQAYSKLTELHLLLEEPEQVIKYADLCLSTLIADEDYINAVNVLLGLSEAYKSLNNLAEASAALDQCIDMANKAQFD